MYAQNNGYYMPNYNPYMINNGAMPDMLNQAKMQYNQPIQQTTQQPLPMTKPINDMLWVLNENEATSYPVAPNNSVVLWDKNKPTIYVKSVNAQGMPSIRILDFEERTEATETPQKHVCKCGDKFATIDSVNALQGKIEALENELEELKAKPKAKTAKKAVEEVENDG